MSYIQEMSKLQRRVGELEDIVRTMMDLVNTLDERLVRVEAKKGPGRPRKEELAHAEDG